MSPSASRSDGAGESRKRVEKRPQAIRDLADIAVYLADESGSDELAFRFLDVAEASFVGGIEVIRVLHAKRDIESLFGGEG
jgi:plasmid stabilization system protein ParE